MDAKNMAHSSGKIKRRNILKYSCMGTCLYVMSPLGIASSNLNKKNTSDSINLTEIENQFIPLADNVRLAARIWMPDNASKENPVPAVLEYIPYRKRDSYRQYDDMIQPLLAEHGYAVVRVDIRGTGESDGLLNDEYTKQEQDDAVELIQWLSKEPWCNGNIGMKGLSWGGINALQVAARNPPALKAIIAHCFTDDRFCGDEHYMGGALLVENFSWGSYFLGVLSMPPDKDIYGNEWKKEWLKRLNNVQPVMATSWLKNQFKNSYWKQGSVSENYSSIKCPVFAVGGHEDAYTDTVPRLLEKLESPCKGLVGPWGHTYPDTAPTGLAIGFEEYSVSWWDHWLKGLDTDVSKIPQLSTYLQIETNGKVTPEAPRGSWVSESVWPKEHTEWESYRVSKNGLVKGDNVEHEPLVLKPDQTVGMNGGTWLSGMPTDQKQDDKKSLVFDTSTLVDDLEILGNPQISLDVSVNRPMAFVAIRLNEVEPDGSSWRVCKSIQNLVHRDSLSSPTTVVPGKRYTLNLDLGFTAYRFKAGNKIRISISSSYWPMIWPSPEPVTLTVYSGEGRLSLPKIGNEKTEPVTYPPSGVPPTPKHETVSAGEFHSNSKIDPDTGLHESTKTWTSGKVKLHPTGTTLLSKGSEVLKINPHDPLTAMYLIDSERTLSRDNWNIAIKSKTVIAATKDNFTINIELQAFNDSAKIFSKTWSETVKRKYI